MKIIEKIKKMTHKDDFKAFVKSLNLSRDDYKAMMEYIDEISAARPEAQWIPVSERLPERADNVIICYKAGDYTLVSTGRYLYKFKMWYVDVVGDLRDGVTAWMPLPDPYKGGDSE